MRQVDFLDNGSLLKNVFAKHATSSIVAMFGATAGIMANSILAGLFFGASGLAVMSVTIPFYSLFAALGSLVGVGGSTLTSYALGRDDKGKANEAFSLSVVLGLILPAIVVFISLPFLEEVLFAFACPPELYAEARFYSIIYVVGGFGTTLYYIPYGFLKLLGRLRAMMGLFLGMAGVNVILDIIFIKFFDMGVEGIALGMVIATVGASVSGIWLLTRGDGFSLVRALKKEDALRLLKLGTPPALNNFLIFLRLLLMNRIIGAAAGSEGLAVFSVLTTLENLSFVVLSGISQATSGFVGVFTKELDTISVRRIEKHAHIAGLVFMLPMMLIMLIFPETVSRAFGFEKAAEATFIFAFGLLPAIPVFLLIFYYQAAGFTILANILVFCRAFLFSVVPVWLLVDTLGLTSVYLSFVISPVCTLLALLPALWYYSKKNMSGIFIQDLEAERNGNYMSFSVNTETNAIIDSLDAVDDFSEKNSLSPKDTMLIRLSLEEMLLSIKQHVFPNKEDATIDVRLLFINRLSGQMIVIRIRNEGALFNPIDYYDRMTDEDPLSLGDALGIAMIAKAADVVHYKSTFGINNLTVIIDKEG